MVNTSRTLIKRCLIIFVVAGITAISLTACNTVSGMGKDIGAVGNGISSVAGGKKSTDTATTSSTTTDTNTTYRGQKVYNYQTKQYEYR